MLNDDVLSQNEVESLLTTISSGAGPRPDLLSTDTSQAPVSNPTRSREKVNPYDFKRPERVGKEQMRGLQSLHEGFGRNFGAALSAMLRTIVEVKLTSVDQLTYSEFVFSLENPTCFNLLRAEPLESNLILDINPSVLYPIIDRLLGGGSDTEPLARRPMTEIELRLVSRITDKFLEELRQAWENVLPLELTVERVENNPQLVQIVPPNEVVVLISFELTLGSARGMINLCIPFNSIERIGHKLSANSWVGYTRATVDDQTRNAISHQLEGAELDLVVTLAETKINTGDLIDLRVGDIITTDHDIHKALIVEVAGVPKFRASPGAWKGQKAVEVVEPIPGKTG